MKKLSALINATLSKLQSGQFCPICGCELDKCDYSPIYGQSYLHPDNGCQRDGWLFWTGMNKQQRSDK